MNEGTALLMVRATVAAADRPGFDAWYRDHHLGLAKRTLRARRAWRFWCRSDPALHVALYAFADMGTLEARMSSPDLQLLLADFDRSWPQVTRTRELVEMVQDTGASG